MDVTAKLRYLRIAPRKVRLVIDAIRGKTVADAEVILQAIPKRSSEPLLKLVRSAVANAEHNFQLPKDGLYIKSIVADEGPKLKRFRPRAFGRAAEILKRSSHVSLVLGSRALPPDRPAAKQPATKGAAAPAKPARAVRAKQPTAKKTTDSQEKA